MSKITDNLNELFDVVDKDDQVIGQAARGEVHKNKKLIHRSVGVAVFNDKGELFLQQRSLTKDTDAGLWTISCSGHVSAGEDYEKTAFRELKEELGVNLLNSTKALDIYPVAKYLSRAPNETEMQMLYKTIFNGPFQLNSSEIIQGKFFTRKELNKAVKSGKIKLSFMGKVALEKLGWIDE